MASVQIRVEVQEPTETIAVTASTDPQLAGQSLSRLAEGKVEWVLLEHDLQAGLLFVREGQYDAILAAEAPVDSASDKPAAFNAYMTWMNASFGRRVCRVWMFVLDKTCHMVRWSGPGLARATRSKLIQQAKDITKTCTAPFQELTVQEHSCQSYDALSRFYYTLTRTEPPPIEEKVEEEPEPETKVEVEIRPEDTPKRTTGFSKSLFANLVGKESEEDACSYYKIKPDFACALNRHIKANSQYFALAWQAGGGSALRIVHLNSELGRCPDQPRCARGLKQQTNAFDLSQLNPRLLAAGAEGSVALYLLPDISDTRLDILPTSTLPVAGKVTVCMFSPHVEDLLCTASFHPDSGPCLQFWDVSNSECVCSINDLHGKKAIDDAAFSPRSSLLATTGKDRFCTILNPLSADPVISRFEAKENTRDCQVLWVDHEHVLTIGLATGSMQSVSLWHVASQPNCLFTLPLGVSPQLPMPFYDPDSNVLIMCSPGSPKVQIFRVIVSPEPAIQALSSFVSPTDFMAQGFLHKTAVNVAEVEILHSLKLSRNKVVSVSWQVPRARKEFFQDDLYVPTLPLAPIMNAQEWRRGLCGKELDRISLQPADMTCLSLAPRLERTPKQAKQEDQTPAWKEALRARQKSVSPSNSPTPTIKTPDKPVWMRKLKEEGGNSPQARPISVEMVGVTVQDMQGLQSSLQSLTDELSNIQWLLLGYTGPTELNVVASGNTYVTGLGALQPHLPVKEIRYLLLRLLDVEENVFRIYFGQITGPKVSPIPKSKSVLHVVELKRFLCASISIAGEFSGLETYDELVYEVGKLKNLVLVTTEAGKKKSLQKPFQLSDEAKFLEAVRQLHSDQDPTDFLVFGYDKDGHIAQQSSGQSGLAGVIEFLQSIPERDNSIFYITLKVLLDGGNGLNVKTVIISWVGADVIPTRKAQSSFDRHNLMQWCQHSTSISAEFEASSLDEISAPTIARKLLGVGRGNQSAVVEGEALASASAQILMGKNMYGGMDSTCVVADLPELIRTLKQLSDNSSGIKWIVLEYDSTDPNGLTVRLADKGEGGVLQWRDRMTNTNVLFALQRMTLLEHGAATKTCMVSWVGLQADPMTKARSSGHQINIHDLLMKYINISARLRLDSKENFTDLDLITKLNHGGGETEEEATPDFQQFACKPITEQVEHQSFVPTVEQAGITFTGTSSEVITQALNDLKSGARSMLKIYLRGKQMRELRVHGLDDKTEKPENTAEPDKPAEAETSAAPPSDVKEDELEVLSEAWRELHLLPTIDHVCVFVLAVKTAEMGYGMSRKFVYVQWIGQSVGMFPRSKALEAHSTLVNLCSSVLQLSGIMEAVKPEEVTRETVLEKITGSKLRVATSLPEKLLNAGSLNEKVALRFEDEPEILRSVDQLVDVANPIAWIILGYKGEANDVLELLATGTEEVAMEGFKSLLLASKSFFVVQQVKWTTDRDMRGLIESERIDKDKEGIHYGLLHWVGSEVGLMEKALSAHHWDAFTRLITTHLASKNLAIQGGHLHATDPEDVTFEEIRMAMRLYD